MQQTRLNELAEQQVIVTFEGEELNRSCLLKVQQEVSAELRKNSNRSRSLESLSREREAQGITPLLSLEMQLPG